MTDQGTQNPYLQRQSKLQALLPSAGIDGLALNPGPSLTYLTGMHFHLMERPIIAIFTPDSPALLVIPELEVEKTKGVPFPLQVFTYGEDPESWPAVFQAALNTVTVGSQPKIGVEAIRMRVLEYRILKQAAPKITLPSAGDLVAELRMRKDSREIAAMRRAASIAQDALLATLPRIKSGVSEQEVASELTLQLLRHGSQPEMPFSPIVSAGPNSANPHASPSDRPLQSGDLLVIDWGATADGYVSDITRTFAIGKIEQELHEIAQIVAQANAAGRAAARPGIAAEEIDLAAREVIDRSGYGAYFIHRTGHGLGMEGHEAPYIREGNKRLLEPGMAFTVEPGIYLPGRNGVRIEDDVIITPSGAESLTDLRRDLIILG